MKKVAVFFLGCVAILGSVGIKADTYKGCYILYNDGSRALIDLWDGMFASCATSPDTLEFGHTEYDPETGEPKSIIHFSVTADKFAGLEMTDDTNSVEAPAADIRLRATADCLYISGTKPGTVASVYTADGSLLFTRSLASEDAVSLAGRPAGIYLIAVNGLTYKFLLK